MDEPCSALDPRSTAVIEDLILPAPQRPGDRDRHAQPPAGTAYRRPRRVHVHRRSGRARRRPIRSSKSRAKSARASTSPAPSDDARGRGARGSHDDRDRRRRLRDDAGAERQDRPQARTPERDRQARRSSERSTGTSAFCARRCCPAAARRRSRSSCTNTSAHAQADFPVLVDVLDSAGRSVYRNDTQGIEPSLQQLALLPLTPRPGGSTTTCSPPAGRPRPSARRSARRRRARRRPCPRSRRRASAEATAFPAPT